MNRGTNTVCLIASVMIIATLLVGCTGGKDKISNYNASLSGVVEEGKNKWEIYKCYNQQLVLVVLNGKIQDKRGMEIENKTINIIKLPEFKKLVSSDITKKEASSKLVWESTLGESAQQVKWYDTMGYKIVFKAETEKFIELYMKNDKDEYKRLIITNSQLSVSDVAGFSFKSIDEYVF